MEIRHNVESMRDTVSQIRLIKDAVESNINEWDSIVNSLGEVWQDVAYDELFEIKESFKKEQTRFLEQIDAYERYIRASAANIENLVNESTGRLANNLK